MASMVMMQPASSSSCSNLGMAVNSLDFSSTLVWPSAKPWDEAHTLNHVNGLFAQGTVVGSLATNLGYRLTHSMNQR